MSIMSKVTTAPGLVLVLVLVISTSNNVLTTQISNPDPDAYNYKLQATSYKSESKTSLMTDENALAIEVELILTYWSVKCITRDTFHGTLTSY